MALALNAVLADPSAAASHLLHAGTVFGVEQAVGRRGVGGAAVLDLTLKPLPAFEREGYPAERVRVVIHPDHEVHAFPQGGRGRAFKHRNPGPLGDLCLQYPGDDPALRWLPEDGLEPLITQVHRHLMAEEAWRRSGDWPFEDAPHGPTRTQPHPVVTPRMQEEAKRWAR
jgi:hypothetical protein